MLHYEKQKKKDLTKMLKNRRLRLIALLLCLCLLLCGCSPDNRLAEALSEQLSRIEMAQLREQLSRIGLEQLRIETVDRDDDAPTHFRDMVYERPSLEELDARIARAEEAMNGGKSYAAVEELLDDCFLYYYHYSTMYTLADIHSCLDLTDEHYAEEYTWCAENYALVQQAMDGLYYACAASPLAGELEENYFWEGFAEQYSDESQSIYTDRMVALMQEESNLIAEYRALSADPIVSFQGREASIYEWMETLRGNAYNQAIIAYFDQYNEPFADLFIRMVAVREQQAEELGFDSYEEMQYLFDYERDYTPAQTEEYLREVRTWIVPLYKDLLNGRLSTRVWTDSVSEEQLQTLLSTACAEIGGDVAEAYDFMIDCGLYDISVDNRKAQMSFQTYLDEYEAPFLFLNARGDTDDILSYAHEFGHYCEAYVNMNAYETIDLAEVYSQGMEYLMLSRLSDQLSERDLGNIARLKMIDTVEMYAQQASFAAFEHEVYAIGSKDLTAEKINEISRQTAIDYGYYEKDYDPFYSESWVDIVHFFEQPFYVISYPVSNDLAIQFYELELAEPGSGMERYLASLERDFTGLMGLVDAGGFESPFAEGRLEKVAAVARSVLDN